MGTAVLVCRALLAAVFLTASIGKFMDLDGSRRSLEAFGVKGDNARVAGTALPVAELATALLLLFRPTAQAGAALALLLLLTFMAGIANALRQGQTPDCNCFGALHSAPAGRNTLGRNAALAAVSIFVLVEGPGPAINTWVADRSGAVIVAIALSLLAVVMGAAALWTWRKNRTLSEQIDRVEGLAAAL